MIAGLYKSKPDTRDYDARDFLASSPKSVPSKYSLDRISSVIDQGNDPYCSPITACTNLEWYYTMQNEKSIDFSEQFIYSKKTEMLNAEGMTPRDTMKILHKVGVPTIKEYREYKKDESKLLESASKHKITAYARIYDVDTMKKCILTYGPIYLGLPVKDFNNPKFWNGSSLLGHHAVPAVGWDESSFIIKNSWGMNWGDNGYCYLDFSEVNKAVEIWTIINI